MMQPHNIIIENRFANSASWCFQPNTGNTIEAELAVWNALNNTSQYVLYVVFYLGCGCKMRNDGTLNMSSNNVECAAKRWNDPVLFGRKWTEYAPQMWLRCGWLKSLVAEKCGNRTPAILPRRISMTIDWTIVCLSVSGLFVARHEYLIGEYHLYCVVINQFIVSIVLKFF